MKRTALTLIATAALAVLTGCSAERVPVKAEAADRQDTVTPMDRLNAEIKRAHMASYGSVTDLTTAEERYGLPGKDVAALYNMRRARAQQKLAGLTAMKRDMLGIR